MKFKVKKKDIEYIVFAKSKKELKECLAKGWKIIEIKQKKRLIWNRRRRR